MDSDDWRPLRLKDDLPAVIKGEPEAPGGLGHMKVDTFGKPDLPTLLAMK